MKVEYLQSPDIIPYNMTTQTSLMNIALISLCLQMLPLAITSLTTLKYTNGKNATNAFIHQDAFTLPTTQKAVVS